jgi:hypothetical protein
MIYDRIVDIYKDELKMLTDGVNKLLKKNSEENFGVLTMRHLVTFWQQEIWSTNKFKKLSR